MALISANSATRRSAERLERRHICKRIGGGGQPLELEARLQACQAGELVTAEVQARERWAGSQLAHLPVTRVSTLLKKSDKQQNGCIQYLP